MTDSESGHLSEYLTIGEAAQELEVSQAELRYWEKKKLLMPVRISSGHRRYRRGDLRRGALIRDLIKKGYTSRGIKNIVSGKKNTDSSGERDIVRSEHRKEMLLDVKREIQALMEMLRGK
ncbi:MAG: MerR family transcriptional regulator [Elusimicrobiales bacterium]|nr:MerR family transcriptional regulator [Elusimicrobiales bacterium]